MIFAAIVTTFVYSRVETVEVADISNVKVSFSLKDGLVYQTSSEPEYTVNLVVEGDKRMLSKLTAEDFRIRKDVYLKDYEKIEEKQDDLQDEMNDKCDTDVVYEIIEELQELIEEEDD